MPHSVASPGADDAPAPEPAAGADVEMTVDTAETDGPEQNNDKPVKSEDKPDVKLEDLFADVDSDDDDQLPPSSRPDGSKPGSSSPPHQPPTLAAQGALEASDPEVMRMFYQRLFPWRNFFQWLNHSPTTTNDFAHREFAFTLPSDIMLRYLSYPTADLLRKDILKLQPIRFEIGPVYTTNPRDRKTLRNTAAFQPLAKELCFDIDLTDYDDVRTCCAKAEICRKCWRFITMAIKVVDTALRDDFGFRHILWVYSGRRGAHAWVCDKAARQLDDQRRRAIAGYLEVVRGGAGGSKKVNVRRPLHPHVTRSLDLLAPYFQHDILDEQDPWQSDEKAEHLLSLLPDRTLNAALRQRWGASPGRSSASKWSDIDATAKTSGGGKFDARALLEAKQDVVLEYAYPRLDIEVSKKLNHLLKSPFVVHPGTGRVCVPIDTRTGGLDAADDFDPLAVPTVQSLLAEIDAWVAQDKEGGEAAGRTTLQDWEKTSLRPYVEYFRSFVASLMKDESGGSTVKREREEGAEGLEF